MTIAGATGPSRGAVVALVLGAVVVTSGCASEPSLSTVASEPVPPLRCQSYAILPDNGDRAAPDAASDRLGMKLVVRAGNVRTGRRIQPDQALVQVIGGSYRRTVPLVDSTASLDDFPVDAEQYLVTLEEGGERFVCGEKYGSVVTGTDRASAGTTPRPASDIPGRLPSPPRVVRAGR